MTKGFDYLFESADQLPPEIAEVVLAFKYTAGFRALVNKYKLHLDQAETIEDMVFHVMFNEMSSSEFTAKLVSEIGLAPVTAKEFTEDANTNIIEAVKKAIEEKVNGMLEEYKDVELDGEEEPAASIPSPQEFHPSKYNEPIVDEPAPTHHIEQIHTNTLTHADVLHGIENPHPSTPHMGDNSMKTVSGSKSYSDIMATSGTPKSQAPEQNLSNRPTILSSELSVSDKPQTPEVKPTPTLQQKVDLIALKSSSVTVSSSSKVSSNLPETPASKLPAISAKPAADPYKESF